MSINCIRASRGGSGVDFEDGAFNLLQAGEHLAEVACLRFPSALSIRIQHLGDFDSAARTWCPIPRALTSCNVSATTRHRLALGLS